jgi:hypothetical protein
MWTAMKALLASAAFVVALPANLFAQAQPTTCSMGQQMCLEQTGRGTRSTSDACRTSFGSCMKSGVWVGPQSGRRWPVEKK